MFEFRDHRLSRRTPEQLAKRIALMLYGSETVFRQKAELGHSYQIGTGNDYFLYVNPGGLYRFVIRYRSKEKSEALQFMFTHYLPVVIVDDATKGGAT